MSDRISRWLALAGLAGFLVATGSPVHAGNLDFLSKSPVSYFNDEDMRLLKETVTQVLDDQDANAKRAGVIQQPAILARWKAAAHSRPPQASPASGSALRTMPRLSTDKAAISFARMPKRAGQSTRPPSPANGRPDREGDEE